MARKRSVPTNDTNKESSMSDMFTPITNDDELKDILAGARGRGDYKTVLAAFIEAGIRLAKVPLDSGLFEGKNPQTVKTGFENARNSKEPPEGADKVKVVKKDDQVYLINQAVTA